MGSGGARIKSSLYPAGPSAGPTAAAAEVGGFAVSKPVLKTQLVGLRVYIMKCPTIST